MGLSIDMNSVKRLSIESPSVSVSVGDSSSSPTARLFEECTFVVVSSKHSPISAASEGFDGEGAFVESAVAAGVVGSVSATGRVFKITAAEGVVESAAASIGLFEITAAVGAVESAAAAEGVFEFAAVEGSVENVAVGVVESATAAEGDFECAAVDGFVENVAVGVSIEKSAGRVGTKYIPEEGCADYVAAEGAPKFAGDK